MFHLLSVICCTPLNTSNGVKTIYWIGTINSDGTFKPDFDTPKEVEMGGMSRHGFGLLSPTFLHHEGKMIMLGIVPDKIDGSYNYQWGWAHNYSLPREVCLADDNDTLVQKPIAGTASLRQKNGVEMADVSLDGEKELEVSGMQIEMYGRFIYDTSKQGFRFLKNGSNYAELSIGGGSITLDLTNMDRIANDNGVYDGIYSAPLSVAASEDVEQHAFLDGSIIDVFVNGTQAFSVRLFPNDSKATDVCLFSSMPKQVPAVSVWSMSEKRASTPIRNIVANGNSKNDSHYYNMQGQRVFAHTRGLIIHNGKKFVNY